MGTLIPGEDSSGLAVGVPGVGEDPGGSLGSKEGPRKEHRV